MCQRQLVYMSLEFRGGIWAADLNLSVISIEMGLKFTRQEENTEE